MIRVLILTQSPQRTSKTQFQNIGAYQLLERIEFANGANGSFFCWASRRKIVFKLKLLGSNFGVSSFHLSGVDTPAYETGRST